MNELKLSKDIYPIIAVRKSSEEFKNIAEITINDDSSDWICSFKLLNDIPLDMLIAEFENYVIDLINSEKIYDTY